MGDWTYTRITTAEYDTASKNFGVVNSKAALDALHPITGDYFLSNFNDGIFYAVDGFCDDWDFVDHAGEGEIWNDVSVSSIDENIPTGGIFYAHVYNDDPDNYVEAWFKLENTGVDIGAGDTIFSAKVLERYESAPADTFSVGVPYVYNGSTWDKMDITQTENAYKAWDCVSNAVTHGIQIPQSSNGLWMMCANFVALNAVIRNLIAQNLKVGNPAIGFSMEATTDGSTGYPTFNLRYNGNSLFRVDPYSGRVFFGEGFWYNPSDKAIHSVNDNIVIGADGKLKTIDAEVSGKVKASTFDFSDINMRWVYQEYEAGSYYIDLTTTFGVTQGDFVTINWSKIEDDPTPGTTVSIILDDSVRDISHSKTIVNSNGVTIRYIRGLGGVDFGLYINTTARTSLAIQAYHKTT